MGDIRNTTNAEAAIRARAYELWESEGRPLGREFDHWRRSELETSLEAAAAVEAEPKAARKPRAKSKSKKAPRETTSATMAEI